MTHLHAVDSQSEAAVRSAIDHAQQLSESTDQRHRSAWAGAAHVGDLSALAMVALADSDSDPEPLAA